MSTVQEELEHEFISVWCVIKQHIATLNREFPKRFQCGSLMSRLEFGPTFQILNGSQPKEQGDS